MRTAVLIAASLSTLSLARTAYAGELDLRLGLQATTTQWPGDTGGGSSLDVGWWIRSWLGVSFVGKEQYAPVDERIMSYLSVNAIARHRLGPVSIGGAVGIVHQHEESRTAVMEQPLASLLGVGDGIRHRAGSRAGLSVALPLRAHAHGAWFVALELDATAFTEHTRGPQWMTSAGLSVGFSYDFTRAR